MAEKITKCGQMGNIWYENERNELHNINDEPAVIWEDGTKRWYKNGKRHRTKGPAVIYPDGDEYWFYEDHGITNKVNQLMNDSYISSDWCNWTEEDEFLFVLLVS